MGGSHRMLCAKTMFAPCGLSVRTGPMRRLYQHHLVEWYSLPPLLTSRWHPDKFLALYGPLVKNDEEREKVEQKLNCVFQDINNSKRF